ncbi:hypothetical protein AGMMS49992_25580 [Clostridia bacterium]|nr:hypothetical protein AGMMS49992_25580 [Clostridia bacterium]
MGLLYTPGDARDLAKKILYAKAHPDTMKAYADAAKFKAEREYTTEPMALRIWSVYQEVMNSSRHGWQTIKEA